MNMTKTAVKQALGIASDADLARFFGISRGAVFHWPADKPIPEVRQWELRARLPSLFKIKKTNAAA